MIHTREVGQRQGPGASSKTSIRCWLGLGRVIKANLD